MKKQANQQISLRRMTRLFLRLMTGLFLLILAWSCTNIPGLQEESPGTYIRIPFVRVLVGESSEPVTMGADGAFAIECLKDGAQDVYYASQSVTLANRAGLLDVTNNKGDLIRENIDEVNIIPRGSSNRLRLTKNKYRGIMRVLPKGGTVEFINIVYMEDYLKGVVPPEIGERADEEIEAVKAQAVAARSSCTSHPIVNANALTGGTYCSYSSPAARSNSESAPIFDAYSSSQVSPSTVLTNVFNCSASFFASKNSSTRFGHVAFGL